MAQKVKSLTAVKETQVWSLDRKDPLGKGKVIHSSILPWRIPWTEEPGRLQSMGSQRVGHDWDTNTYTLSDHCVPPVGWEKRISLEKWNLRGPTPRTLGRDRRKQWGHSMEENLGKHPHLEFRLSSILHPAPWNSAAREKLKRVNTLEKRPLNIAM